MQSMTAAFLSDLAALSQALVGTVHAAAGLLPKPPVTGVRQGEE